MTVGCAVPTCKPHCPCSDDAGVHLTYPKISATCRFSFVVCIDLYLEGYLALPALLPCCVPLTSPCRVPGVVDLCGTADDTSNVYLVFEPCCGGDLYKRLANQGLLNEAQLCRQVRMQLLAGPAPPCTRCPALRAEGFGSWCEDLYSTVCLPSPALGTPLSPGCIMLTAV